LGGETTVAGLKSGRKEAKAPWGGRVLEYSVTFVSWDKIKVMNADDPRLAEFKDLWTTRKDEYVFVSDGLDGVSGPFWVAGRELSYLVIDDFDDEVSAAVLRLMAEAGVRTVASMDEARALIKKR